MAVSLDTLRRDMALRIAIRVDEEQVHHLTIAVRVPIVSGRADQDHIGHSVTEVLITELARLSPFKVIAHQSVLSYSADPPPLKQIGADLGIDTVIEGAIDTSGSRVLVTLRIVDVATDRHIWADTFEGRERHQPPTAKPTNNT